MAPSITNKHSHIIKEIKTQQKQLQQQQQAADNGKRQQEEPTTTTAATKGIWQANKFNNNKNIRTIHSVSPHIKTSRSL